MTTGEPEHRPLHRCTNGAFFPAQLHADCRKLPKVAWHWGLSHNHPHDCYEACPWNPHQTESLVADGPSDWVGIQYKEWSVRVALGNIRVHIYIYRYSWFFICPRGVLFSCQRSVWSCFRYWRHAGASNNNCKHTSLKKHILYCIYTNIHTCMHTYITLHYIELHYIELHYITLHYITLHTLHTYIHYITLLYITLRYVTLHYFTLHTYIHNIHNIHNIHTCMHACMHAYMTLHDITWHYMTLHYIMLHYITLYYIRLHNIILYYSTLYYIIWH